MSADVVPPTAPMDDIAGASLILPTTADDDVGITGQLVVSSVPEVEPSETLYIQNLNESIKIPSASPCPSICVRNTDGDHFQ